MKLECGDVVAVYDGAFTSGRIKATVISVDNERSILWAEHTDVWGKCHTMRLHAKQCRKIKVKNNEQ